MRTEKTTQISHQSEKILFLILCHLDNHKYFQSAHPGRSHYRRVNETPDSIRNSNVEISENTDPQVTPEDVTKQMLSKTLRKGGKKGREDKEERRKEKRNNRKNEEEK